MKPATISDVGRQPGYGRRAVAGAAAWLVVIALAAVGLGSWSDVGALYRQGRFAEAAELLSSTATTGRPGERLLWQMRLADRPDRLLELCATALAEPDLPKATRQQFVLQAASIETARGNHREALALLLPAIDQDDELPGAFYHLAGRNYLAAGSTQRAREMFASVKVSDAAFPAARYELGRIGLLTEDTTLAQRYFESALRHPDAAHHPALLLGRYEALRRGDQAPAAEEVGRQLMREYPESLAALVLRDRWRRETEQSAPAPAVVIADSAAEADDAQMRTEAEILANPISIQLAAFSDRSLAMEFVERWQRQLPDLRIDEEVGRRGEPLYKIRTGRFANRTRADTEALRITDEFGLETLVVQLYQ